MKTSFNKMKSEEVKRKEMSFVVKWNEESLQKHEKFEQEKLYEWYVPVFLNIIWTFEHGFNDVKAKLFGKV